jgi:hypothetical protein
MRFRTSVGAKNRDAATFGPQAAAGIPLAILHPISPDAGLYRLGWWHCGPTASAGLSGMLIHLGGSCATL